ncbi:MAG: DUF4129 domain-containing protein [Mucilaginibacter sp.]|nr:DUF4129 domain-containing protein [Mucilaginibacter sp.]
MAALSCFAKTDTVAKKKPAVVRYDTASVAIRHFDATAINEFKKQPEFNYNDNYSGPSLWTRFWKWFWSLFDFGKTTTGYSRFWVWVGRILKYLVIVGGVGALVLLILKSAGIDLGLFRKRSRSAGIPYGEFDENIHEIDFAKDIEQAASAGNYKLAVRLLYLRTLKQLNDNGLIEWQPNKTNQAYVMELSNSPNQDIFKQLTNQFEYVWYGDFAVTGDSYKNISQMFGSFKEGRS